MRGRAKGKRRVVGEAEEEGDRGEREGWRMRMKIKTEKNVFGCKTKFKLMKKQFQSNIHKK